MMLLVSGGNTNTVNRYKQTPYIGRLIVPRSQELTHVVEGFRWAADNGAYSGFNASAFRAMLEKYAVAQSTCKFVASPDVVKNHAGTLWLFDEWEPKLHGQGWPVAFVAQDGCTIKTIPWDKCEALFIGGSTGFKISSTPLIQEAKRRGKWVHVGRVNTLRRMEWIHRAGADSFDGTSVSRWSNTYIPWVIKYLHWLDRYAPHVVMPSLDQEGSMRG